MVSKAEYFTQEQGEQVAPVPPLTNRGVSTPRKVQFQGLDYLRLSVWCNPDWLMYLVEGAVVEKHAIPDFDRWKDAGAAKRIKVRYECGIDGLEVHDHGDYVGLQIKGETCRVLGQECLLYLIDMVASTGVRWHATRCDFAWDHVPWTCKQFHQRLKAGQVRSRANIKPWPVGDLDVPGSTVYTYKQEEGKSRPERWAYTYDKRGPVRFEIRSYGDYAKQIGRALVGMDFEDMRDFALSYTRGYMDMVTGSNPRMERRKLWRPWKQFIDDARVFRPAVGAVQHVRDKRGVEFLGLYDGLIQRDAKRLQEAIEAYGADWLLRRIALHASGRVDQADVERLRLIQGSAWRLGICGVPEPERGPEPPI